LFLVPAVAAALFSANAHGPGILSLLEQKGAAYLRVLPVKWLGLFLIITRFLHGSGVV
jgi:hypothetical protein